MPYYPFNSSLSLQSGGLPLTGVSVLNLVNGEVVKAGTVANLTMPSVTVTDGVTSVDNVSQITVSTGLVLGAPETTPSIVSGQTAIINHGDGNLSLPNAPQIGNYILFLWNGLGGFSINDPTRYPLLVSESSGFDGGTTIYYYGGFYDGDLIPEATLTGSSNTAVMFEIENVKPGFEVITFKSNAGSGAGAFTVAGPALDANIYTAFWAFQCYPQNGPNAGSYVPTGTVDENTVLGNDWGLAYACTLNLTNETPEFGATLGTSGGSGAFIGVILQGTAGTEVTIST